MSEPTEADKFHVLCADIAEDLRGTCTETLEGVCAERGVTTTPELEREVDQIVFSCDTCGWWCERSEESETPGVCDDCEDEDDDD